MKKNSEISLMKLERPNQDTTVAVFSDTHGKKLAFIQAIELAQSISKGIDLMVHLGDYADDVGVFEKLYPDTPLCVIRGNNDYNQRFLPDEILLDINGVRIYCTHGHKHSFSNRISSLSYKAEELNACMALFGHTHSFFHGMQGNICIANPGSVSLPRDGSKGTFALVKVKSNTAVAEIHELSKRCF